jgi:CRP-like cAMP-binding protein
MLAASRQLGMRNKILGSIPHEEFAHLLPHLEEVRLEKGETVYLSGDNIKYAYFPENGLLSLLVTTKTGSTIEVASVGSEGVLGLPIILGNHVIPYEVTVQFTTQAWRIRAQRLQEEFDKGKAFHEFVLRYLNVLIAQISQSSNLNLTHESISHTLGVPRTAVTGAALELQRAGAIRYMRGNISILDRTKLEEKSCECYRIVRDELEHFLSQ